MYVRFQIPAHGSFLSEAYRWSVQCVFPLIFLESLAEIPAPSPDKAEAAPVADGSGLFY